MGSSVQVGTRSSALKPSTPYAHVRAAIAASRCVVLDGGVATELEHRHGQDERLWGVEALISEPEDVLDVHRRYVAAGADVITTNTWGLMTTLSVGAPMVDEHGRPVHWMDLARRGVRVARTAIAEAGLEGRRAVAFSVNGDVDGPEGAELVDLLARALADEPPDLILLETLSVLRPSLDAVVERLVATGMPVWMSFRRCRHGLCGVYGQHWSGPEGDAFGRAARRFEQLGVGALLVNCIPPDHVAGMVSYLRDYTDVPLGVYPNLGYHTNAGWRFDSQMSGADFADLALGWREEGAQIIGGCCGTGPEHVAAAARALVGAPRGRRRVAPALGPAGAAPPPPEALTRWEDGRGHALAPLPFPTIASHRGVTSVLPGSYTLWKHLFETRAGAHRRCLDAGSGAGLQTVQLALNGAAHVHALDVDEAAVIATMDNAFRNGVADRVSAQVADLYPWVPEERYELIVANLPQTPMDPALSPSSHRPTDYWGRGLVDQLIGKLGEALAAEGSALVAVSSLLSTRRTAEAVAAAGLRARVAAWAVEPSPLVARADRPHLDELERLSDAYHLDVGTQEAVVTYVLELRHAGAAEPPGEPWPARA